MKLKELSQLLIEAVHIGTGKAIAETGGLPAHLCKADAYRLYGRNDVDRWIEEKLIIPAIINGKVSTKFFDRIQLERIARSSNRLTYLPVADR